MFSWLWPRIVPLFLLVGIGWAFYRFFIFRLRLLNVRIKHYEFGTHCICGYPLKGLDLPRCPECGRVIGFDANPEQLGLSDNQLRRVQAARLKRQRDSETG
jgi:hypothetical protein